jgi:NADPH:quinone reductase-like Zn-dependent oxidoreductase
MSHRVQFDRYGPVDLLQIAEVPRPSAGEGQVLVEVAAAGINPGEIAIRNGAMEAMFPATFPSGQGSDFAGRVVETGPGVTGFAPGDEVMGWSDRRSAQADHVLSDPRHLIAKPSALDWIRAGAMWAIGVTSFSAVRAVAIRAGTWWRSVAPQAVREDSPRSWPAAPVPGSWALRAPVTLTCSEP